MSLYRNLVVLFLSIVCTFGVCYRVDGQEIISLDFTSLPFPDGTILTTEFQGDGIIFSDDDTGMNPAFPCPSLAGMENIVFTGQLNNLFRLEFATALPVVEVLATFMDQNSNDQIHELFELDSGLQVVRSVTFDDTGVSGAQFDLQISNPDGIAGIAACEQPLGAEAFVSIMMVTADPLFSDGFETGDTMEWSSAVP